MPPQRAGRRDQPMGGRKTEEMAVRTVCMTAITEGCVSRTCWAANTTAWSTDAAGDTHMQAHPGVQSQSASPLRSCTESALSSQPYAIERIPAWPRWACTPAISAERHCATLASRQKAATRRHRNSRTQVGMAWRCRLVKLSIPSSTTSKIGLSIMHRSAVPGARRRLPQVV